MFRVCHSPLKGSWAPITHAGQNSINYVILTAQLKLNFHSFSLRKLQHWGSITHHHTGTIKIHKKQMHPCPKIPSFWVTVGFLGTPSFQALSLSHTHTHTHSLTNALLPSSVSLTHTHTHTHSLTPSFQALSLSHTHTHTHSLTNTLLPSSVSLTHTHTHTLTH